MKQLYRASKRGFTLLYAPLEDGRILVIADDTKPGFEIITAAEFRRLTKGYYFEGD